MNECTQMGIGICIFEKPQNGNILHLLGHGHENVVFYDAFLKREILVTASQAENT